MEQTVSPGGPNTAGVTQRTAVGGEVQAGVPGQATWWMVSPGPIPAGGDEEGPEGSDRDQGDAAAARCSEGNPEECALACETATRRFAGDSRRTTLAEQTRFRKRARIGGGHACPPPADRLVRLRPSSVRRWKASTCADVRARTRANCVPASRGGGASISDRTSSSASFESQPASSGDDFPASARRHGDAGVSDL